MSYVDAIHEKAKDTITVVERVDGKRIVTRTTRIQLLL